MRFKTALLPLLLACAFNAQAASPPEPEPELAPKSSALDAGLFYQLLLGELNARAQEPGTAFALMLDAARKTQDPVVYRRAVQIALQARSGESALQAANAWSQAHPASAEANLLVLQILLGLNRPADTLQPLKKAIALASAVDQRGQIWGIPASFERVSDKTLAAATVQKALAGYLNDARLGATAWAAVGRMWLAAGDKARSLNAATQGSSQGGEAEHPALLALALLSPDLPQAEQLVKKHLPQARPEFHMAYVKALLTQQRLDDAQTQLRVLQLRAPDYADAWLIDGALALQARDHARAEQQLRHYLTLVEALAPQAQLNEVRRGRSQALFSLAQLAQQRQDWAAADAWLQRINHPDDVLQAQIRRAHVLAQQGQLEDALRLVRNQPELNEADARTKRNAEVQLLRDQNQLTRARDTLLQFIAQHPDDLDLVYELAMVHEKLGDLPEMERLLRGLMLARPDDPHAFNALGYSLADHNLRLDEAIELINKALTLAPNDPFITDSLAWAEFRRGNPAEAVRLLRAAYKAKPDAEIAAHLGEVLWNMGQQPTAIEVFKEGLKLNPDNETLRHTLKRLSVPL